MTVGNSKGGGSGGGGGGGGMSSKKLTQFAIGVGGIYVSYMLFGIIQESLFSKTYVSADGSSTSRFAFPWAMLFWQNLLSTALSYVMNLRAGTPIMISYKEQIFVGACNAGSMLGSTTALQYMSYPLQALFKSCKVLSVLLVGLIFGKTKYPLKQYLTGAVVTAGIIGFNLFEEKKGGKETQLIGLVVIVISLFCDGMLAEKQQEIRARFNPTSFQLMEICSKWGVIFSLLYAVVMGQFLPFINFCVSHPQGAADLLIISLLGCIGQVFIFYTIKHFGAVLLALVTTTRKFFTVLASIIYFQHQLASLQWLCILLILIGVSIELVESLNKKQKSHENNGAAVTPVDPSKKGKQGKASQPKTGAPAAVAATRTKSKKRKTK